MFGLRGVGLEPALPPAFTGTMPIGLVPPWWFPTIAVGGLSLVTAASLLPDYTAFPDTCEHGCVAPFGNNSPFQRTNVPCNNRSGIVKRRLGAFAGVTAGCYILSGSMAMTISNIRVPPVRRNPTWTDFPGVLRATAIRKASGVRTRMPSSVTITSPT